MSACPCHANASAFAFAEATHTFFVEPPLCLRLIAEHEQSGALYVAQVSPTTSSTINVSGTASLAGGARANFLPHLAEVP